MKYDVVIAGAGVAGLLSGIELATAGLKVCMLERGKVGRESSWAGGGILSPLYPWRYPDAVNQLAQWSVERYPAYLQQLQKDTGIDPEWLTSGHLILDYRDEESGIEQWSKTFNVNIQQIHGDQLKAIEPRLAQQHTSALWAANIGQVRNPCLLQALQQRALQLGIEIKEDTALNSVKTESHKITGISTNRGYIQAGKLLMTTGAWSGSAGDYEGSRPEVEPVKGQMIQFQTQPGTIRTITLYNDHYVIPRKDGKVLAGSTLEHCGFDKSTDSSAADQLRSRAIELFPVLKDAPIINHWAGLRPGNKRQTPFVCQHPDIENLYFNTGHYRNGIILGLASARLCADILLQHTPILPPEEYRL